MLLLGIAVGVGVMGLLSLVLSGRETPTHTEQAEEVIYDSAQAAPAARPGEDRQRKIRQFRVGQ